MVIDEVTIGLVGGMVAALTALYTIAANMLLRRRERRRVAADLFAEFYTGEFYRYSVLPVYRLLVKVRAMTLDERRIYLETVAYGWIGCDSAEDERDHFITIEEQRLDASTAHYRNAFPMGEHTEHDALVIFLYFWVRTDRLIQAGLVDTRLFARLFSNSFAYYEDFLHELADIMTKLNGKGNEPSWIEAMRRIDALVDKH